MFVFLITLRYPKILYQINFNVFKISKAPDFQTKLVLTYKLPFLVPRPVHEVPERIKKWREEQAARLDEKDLEEEKAKAELREQAKKELEDWKKRHDETISKTKSTNR